MSITQTVEIPVNHKLTIDVPPEVPAGPVILTFTPATTLPCNDTAVEPQPSVQREGSPLDGLNSAGECPVCAAHRDPITGNPRYNAETVTAIEEGRAMMRGEIPSKLYNSLEEMLVDLDSDD
jgi:hypothetical protein